MSTLLILVGLIWALTVLDFWVVLLLGGLVWLLVRK